MQEFDLIVKVRARDLPSGKVAEIIDRLINTGLADATRTLEYGEGDIEGAAAAVGLHIAAPVAVHSISLPPTTVVPVTHWDSRRYGGDSDGEETFLMEITDHRAMNGQVYVDVAAVNGNVNDMLCATVEINRVPGGSDDVQCLHLNFDSDNLAASFFKQGDRYIILPERGVSIRNTVLPNGERGWILE